MHPRGMRLLVAERLGRLDARRAASGGQGRDTRNRVGEEAVAASLAGLREEIADLNAQIDAGEAIADRVPHRERYLRLNHRLARRIVTAHEDWLDEVERELATGSGDAERPG